MYITGINHINLWFLLILFDFLPLAHISHNADAVLTITDLFL